MCFKLSPQFELRCSPIENRQKSECRNIAVTSELDVLPFILFLNAPAVLELYCSFETPIVEAQPPFPLLK